jgi:hypothetical protein
MLLSHPSQKREGWGSLGIAGAGEKQRQKQPQVLPSAFHPIEQKTLDGDPVKNDYGQDDTALEGKRCSLDEPVLMGKCDGQGAGSDCAQKAKARHRAGLSVSGGDWL